MAGSTLEERIKKHEAAAARLRAKLTAAARKLDTRRKVLAGAAILAEIGDDPTLRERVCAILDRRLTRADDRALLADLLSEASNGPLRP